MDGDTTAAIPGAPAGDAPADAPPSERSSLSTTFNIVSPRSDILESAPGSARNRKRSNLIARYEALNQTGNDFAPQSLDRSFAAQETTFDLETPRTDGVLSTPMDSARSLADQERRSTLNDHYEALDASKIGLISPKASSVSSGRKSWSRPPEGSPRPEPIAKWPPDRGSSKGPVIAAVRKELEASEVRVADRVKNLEARLNYSNQAGSGLDEGIAESLAELEARFPDYERQLAGLIGGSKAMQEQLFSLVQRGDRAEAEMADVQRRFEKDWRERAEAAESRLAGMEKTVRASETANDERAARLEAHLEAVVSELVENLGGRLLRAEANLSHSGSAGSLGSAGGNSGSAGDNSASGLALGSVQAAASAAIAAELKAADAQTEAEHAARVASRISEEMQQTWARTTEQELVIADLRERFQTQEHELRELTLRLGRIEWDALDASPSTDTVCAGASPHLAQQGRVSAMLGTSPSAATVRTSAHSHRAQQGVAEADWPITASAGGKERQGSPASMLRSEGASDYDISSNNGQQEDNLADDVRALHAMVAKGVDAIHALAPRLLASLDSGSEAALELEEVMQFGQEAQSCDIEVEGKQTWSCDRTRQFDEVTMGMATKMPQLKVKGAASLQCTMKALNDDASACAKDVVAATSLAEAFLPPWTSRAVVPGRVVWAQQRLEESVNGRWAPPTGGPVVIKDFVIMWGDGAATDISRIGQGVFSAELRGKKRTATRQGDDLLVWSNGETWTRQDAASLSKDWCRGHVVGGHDDGSYCVRFETSLTGGRRKQEFVPCARIRPEVLHVFWRPDHHRKAQRLLRSLSTCKEKLGSSCEPSLVRSRTDESCRDDGQVSCWSWFARS